MAALVYCIFDRVPIANIFETNSLSSSKKAFVGVINGKGEWVIPPRYIQIIYMHKTDTFWVKVRESDVSKTWIHEAMHSVGGNRPQRSTNTHRDA